MGDVLKLLYIVVVDEEDNNDDSSRQERLSFRYTRAVLQSTLQLMGCKPRHAFKISKRVFAVTRDEARSDPTNKRFTKQNSIQFDPNGGENAILFELYKRKTTVIISREKFLRIVCHALSLYKYMGPNQRADLVLACRIRERKESVTILLCGTSGCGKSTLSALLGHRLGITSVVSTDSIRHMMRSFADEKENPLLWASTYHAGEYLDPVLVAQSKAKKMANKLLNNGKNKSDEISSDPTVGIESEVVISKKQMAIEGYKAQSEMVIDSLDRLITSWEDKKESVIIEGVHLSLNFVMGLMKKHPSIIPFMVYISNETKHMERFAVRAKYMTLDPEKNKYIKYLKNIRTIQEYLIKRAEKHLIPKINNTNVDRSVASIHATVFSCLRKHDPLYDPLTNTLPVLDEEFRNQCAANSLSSKGMFQLIQRQGSSRHLMALVNTDGTVAKAWPVARSESGMNKGEKCVGDPLYGPVNIGSAEPVNLQFGGFGISAWPRDTGGASHVGSNDEGVANGCGSSCSSSPAKELVEEVSMSSSDEEQDLRDGESDEDLSDTEKNDVTDDMEGSVDENSTKTDEEYEDLEYLTDEDNNDPVSKEKSQEKNVLESSLEDSMSGKDHGGPGERKKIVRTRQRALSDSLRFGRARNRLTKSLSLCHPSVIKEAHETS